MPTLNKNLNVTELDFDQIKDNLIKHFSNADSPFKDWDFSGSGLNILLDALAYNTHYNAVLAHMGISESFIDSAQLRSSVVSLAKLIGYVPRSYSAPTALINISFIAKNNNSPSSIVLQKGTSFSTVTNDKKFIYVTDDEHILLLEDGKYVGTNIRIKQGTYQTKRFQINNLADASSISYEIDDYNIDLTTLTVKTYESASSSIFNVYNMIDDISGVDGKSLIYFISENANSNYQISFGNNIFGKRPSNLSVIEVNYLITDGDESNNSKIFTYNGSEMPGISRSPIVTTVNQSVGGGSNESIESIRHNAPISFITQNRAVTADDYKNLIFKKFNDVQTVSVWGGEDNEPPVYGKVFIAVKPKGSDILTAGQRKDINDFLYGKKILSIFPELVDPEYLTITLDVFFKYNQSATTLNTGSMEASIYNVVKAYNDEYLQSFDGMFRHSVLTRKIDTYSQAMLNSHVRVFVTKSFVLNPLQAEKKNINFSSKLVPDDGNAIISCSSFMSNGIETFIGDEANPGDEVNRRVFTYYYRDLVKVKINLNVGNLNLETGTLQLNEIYPDELTTITIDMLPISNDLVPKRNQLLYIDMSRVFIRGEIDSIIAGGSSKSINYNTFKRDR